MKQLIEIIKAGEKTICIPRGYVERVIFTINPMGVAFVSEKGHHAWYNEEHYDIFTESNPDEIYLARK